MDKLEATQHFKLLKNHIKRGQCQFLATFFHTAAVVMLAYVEAVHKQVKRGLHEQEDHLGFEVALLREKVVQQFSLLKLLFQELVLGNDC